MKRQHWITAACVVIVGSAVLAQNPAEPTKPPATGTLDLIPENALAAVVLRSPNDLGKKGDQLFKDLDFDPVPGETPSSALNKLIDFLIGNFVGVRQGLDLDGSMAVIVPPEPEGKEPKVEALLGNLVLALPVSDREQMAANFGFAKGELPEGKVRAAKKGVNDKAPKVVALRGRHIFLATHERILQPLLQARPLAGRLSEGQRATFDAADLLVYVNPQSQKEWQGFRNDVEATSKRWTSDPQDRKTIEQFLKSLGHLNFILAGGRLDQGFGLNVLLALDDKAAEVKELLGALRAEGAAHVHGLPKGRLVATQAFALGGRRRVAETSAGPDGKQPRPLQAVLARVLAEVYFENVLEKQKLTSPADRPTFLGVFTEVWERLHGSRIGVYLTSDESRFGLFSAIAILDTSDAPQFLADLRALAKIADGTLDLAKAEVRQEVNLAKLIDDLSHERYAVRAPASTKLRLIGEPALLELEKAVEAKRDLETVRRLQKLIAEISTVAAERRQELKKDVLKFVRPTFAWVAQAETRVGQPVDIVHIKLQDAEAATAKALKQYLGPDWDKMRLAVRGKQVVVLLGSEVDLLEQTLKKLEDHGKAEAALDAKAGAAVVQFQLSLESLSSLFTGKPRRLPGERLTSFALHVPESGLQFDLQAPTEELRILFKLK